MRQWIAAVTAASVLAAGAMALTPKGRVRQVTRLACGILCALAVVSPVVRLDVDGLAAGMAEYRRRADEIVDEAEQEARYMDRTYIEQRCQAYISDKAAEAGRPVGDVRVTARWDEDALIWVPWSAAVDAAYDEALSAAIEGQLGIPAARQSWRSAG